MMRKIFVLFFVLCGLSIKSNARDDLVVRSFSDFIVQECRGDMSQRNIQRAQSHTVQVLLNHVQLDKSSPRSKVCPAVKILGMISGAIESNTKVSYINSALSDMYLQILSKGEWVGGIDTRRVMTKEEQSIAVQGMDRAVCSLLDNTPPRDWGDFQDNI